MKRMAWVAVSVTALVLAGILAWYIAATNVETPDYALERSDGDMELRRYPPMIAAEVTQPGSREQAVRAAFSPLAGYIFAKDRGGPSIAMTAPVTQTPDKIAMTAPVTQTGADGGWAVRFLMPAGSTVEALPAPAGAVTLKALPETTLAAVRFSGRWTDANFDRAEIRLRDWIERSGLRPIGPATYAYYNDPFTPFFLRRNEVMIDVEPVPEG